MKKRRNWFETECEEDLVEFGDYLLRVDGLLARITTVGRRRIRYSQFGACRPENGGKVLDWIQETIMRVRGV